MEWARILAYVTGTVDQELLARNEYLAAENRILEAQLKGRLKRWPLSPDILPGEDSPAAFLEASVVRSVVGCKQPVAQEIIRGARPRFVGVAAEVRAHGDHEFPGMGVADVDVHVKDKVGDLLHSAGDREVGAKPQREICVASSARLQIALMRLCLDWSDVNDD